MGKGLKDFHIEDYIKPHPKQREAMSWLGKGKKIFYGGKRGGGKSHMSLDAAIICCLQFPRIRVLIARETMPELEENFISKFKERFPPEVSDELYRYHENKNTATFFNGSKLIFRAIPDDKAARKVQGIEYQLLIIDEAPNLPTRMLQKVQGSARRAGDMPFKPTILFTGNPGGISHHWFKTRFVRPDYSKWDANELKYKQDYVFVEASLEDNPSVGAEYRDMLDSLPDDLRAMWLEGDWDKLEGQFFTEWNPQYHVVTPFAVPDHWDKIRAMDLGFSDEHPTVCLWLTKSPDDDPIHKGCVYVYREYHNNAAIADYIQDINALTPREETISVTYCDPAMFFSTTKATLTADSPDMMFSDGGIPLSRANNDRQQGWTVLKQWLHWEFAKINEQGEEVETFKPPMLRIFSTCSALISALPEMQYDQTRPGDLNTKARHDDFADALRYGIIMAWEYPGASSGDEDDFSEEHDPYAFNAEHEAERYASTEIAYSFLDDDSATALY